MITYTVKKAPKGKENLIVKSGQSHEFKMSDVKIHMEQLEKQAKEFKAQSELEVAKMKNIERNHEIALALTDVQLVAIALYAQSKALFNQSRAKWKAVMAQIKEYKSELADIKKQTGYEL